MCSKSIFGAHFNELGKLQEFVQCDCYKDPDKDVTYMVELSCVPNCAKDAGTPPVASVWLKCNACDKEVHTQLKGFFACIVDNAK